MVRHALIAGLIELVHRVLTAGRQYTFLICTIQQCLLPGLELAALILK